MEAWLTVSPWLAMPDTSEVRKSPGASCIIAKVITEMAMTVGTMSRMRRATKTPTIYAMKYCSGWLGAGLGYSQASGMDFGTLWKLFFTSPQPVAGRLIPMV